MLKTNQNSFCLFNEEIYAYTYVPFLLERRFMYSNINEFVRLKDVVLSFNTLNQTTSLYNGLIANFFFLRIFTNKTPFFFPVKIISTFKHKSYNFCCQLRLSKKQSSLFILRDLSFASKNVSLNDFGLYKHRLMLNNITFFVKNFPYMRIVETHPLFFKWNECLDITINLSAYSTKSELKDLLILFKFNKDTLYLL